MGKGVHRIGLGHFEDTHAPVLLAALGGMCISVVGVLVPPSMFWAEFEMDSIAEPGKPLAHIWPQARTVLFSSHFYECTPKVRDKWDGARA